MDDFWQSDSLLSMIFLFQLPVFIFFCIFALIKYFMSYEKELSSIPYYIIYGIGRGGMLVQRPDL